MGKYTGMSNYLSHLLLLDVFRKYRFIAYKQLTWWCWGWLGRHNRVCLPSCAVKKIRERFSSTHYIGFKYPSVTL